MWLFPLCTNVRSCLCGSKKLNQIVAVQVCDVTMLQMYSAAGYKIKKTVLIPGSLF
jgi:hypothetical protein